MNLPVKSNFLSLANIPEELADAINDFILIGQREKFHTQSGAKGRCGYASRIFSDFLFSEAIHSTQEIYYLDEFWDGWLSRLYLPYPISPVYRCHVVVRCKGLIIDWTSRQFEKDLPFPSIWEAPHKFSLFPRQDEEEL